MDERIWQLIVKAPLTPDEVAKRLEISWSTANSHLLKLVGEGKALLLRKGRVNVYHAKTRSVHSFSAPNWVKAKPLEQLAHELKDLLPADMTAAEMIEKERRRA